MSSFFSTAGFGALACWTAIAIPAASNEGGVGGVDGIGPVTAARPPPADTAVTGWLASTTSMPCCAARQLVVVSQCPVTGSTGTVQVTGFVVPDTVTLAVMVTFMAIFPLFGLTVLLPLMT